MSYEIFRSKFAASIGDQFAPGQVHDILQALDRVAAGYEIRKTCTDLIVPGVLPEVARMYIASLAVEKKSDGTLRDYERILRIFFESISKPYNTVTTNDVRVYLYQYQQTRHVASSTIEHLRIVLNGFYTWLVDEELMERNPVHRIRPIEVPKSGRTALPPLSLEYLRQACVTPREKALVDFLFSTGCRVSECAALTLNDIGWTDRSVRISHGKGDKARTVYFNAESEVSLKNYLASRRGDSSVLFCNSRAPYGHVSPKALQNEITHIRDRVTIEKLKVTPHILRHTFATTAINHGMPVQEVQQLMGHASLDTTMIYTHIEQEDIKASYRKYVV